MIRIAAAAAMALALFPASEALAEPPPALRLVAAYVPPAPLVLDGQPVGGLSGLDYDAKTGLWYLISDDKGEHGPSSLYTARFRYGLDGRTDFSLVSRIPLQPAARVGGASTEALDSEAVRLTPKRDLLWSTEGDYAHGFGPAVRRMSRSGRWLQTLTLPAELTFDPAGRRGPRGNLSFEGLAFSPDHSLWLSMEAPLIEDGPVASLKAGALVRITHFDPQGREIGQYAYSLDPIVEPPAGRFADNGVSEILALDGHALLVLERSGVQGADGAFRFHCRLYRADFKGAQDVSALPAVNASTARPVAKTLVFDFDHLIADSGGKLKPDNLEGMTFGPRLADGRRSLVLVSDDNFDARQQLQLLVFEVDGRLAP